MGRGLLPPPSPPSSTSTSSRSGQSCVGHCARFAPRLTSTTVTHTNAARLFLLQRLACIDWPGGPACKALPSQLLCVTWCGYNTGLTAASQHLNTVYVLGMVRWKHRSPPAPSTAFRRTFCAPTATATLQVAVAAPSSPAHHHHDPRSVSAPSGPRPRRTDPYPRPRIS